MSSLYTIQVNTTGSSKKKKLSGKDYLVVDATILLPDVIAGSEGPLYYPADQIANSQYDWNGMPVVLYHPKKNGVYVSARNPSVLNSVGLGNIYNAKLIEKGSKKGGLSVEVWLDTERCQELIPETYEKIENNEPVEISTGLSSRRVEEEGVVNNQAYTHKVEDIHPDHLAVLPDQKGACSNEKGCGIHVNQPLTHDDLRQELSKAVANKFENDVNGRYSYTYVLDVKDDQVVYYHNDAKYRVGYTTNDVGQVTLSDDKPVRVMRQTSYVDLPDDDDTSLNSEMTRVVARNQDPNRGKNMERDQLIDSIIANSEAWKESDKPTLNSLSNAQLTAIHGQNKPAENPVEKPKEPEQQKVTANCDENKDWAAKVFSDLGIVNVAEAKSALANAIALEKQTKTQIVNKLTAELKDEEKTEVANQLMAKDLQELQTLEKLLPKQKAEAAPQGRFAGLRTGAYAANAGAPVQFTSNEETQTANAIEDDDDVLLPFAPEVQAS